jgi:chromosome segregation ATPase
MQKFLNGQLVDLTQEEINQRNQDIENWNNTAFDRSMQSLRSKRNNLLAQTDYLALSDQTMTAEMTTYRQALRDITNGLTTVADVEAVVFPEKPGA